MEGLLENQIFEDFELSGMLASFQGKPAFFCKKIPDETDPGWLYPYVVYDMNMREDPARNRSGTLLLHIYCSDESGCFDEESILELKELESALITVISGTIYTPETQKTSICAVWNHSEAFECEPALLAESDEYTAPVWGLKMSFDLMSFPVQMTADPDPVRAINEWTKSIFDSAGIIAYDTLPEVWKPTNNQPALYWRLNSIVASDDQSNTTIWFDCKITGHVITGNVTDRTAWLKTLAEELNVSGELPLTEDSNFVVKRVTIKPGADPFQKGQIIVKGRYGFLRKTPEQGERLENLNFR